jgi:hypothetical protein
MVLAVQLPQPRLPVVSSEPLRVRQCFVVPKAALAHHSLQASVLQLSASCSATGGPLFVFVLFLSHALNHCFSMMFTYFTLRFFADLKCGGESGAIPKK